MPLGFSVFRLFIIIIILRSSWTALAPGSEHPLIDFCDAASLMAAADALVRTGLVDAGYRAFHLDGCDYFIIIM